MADPCWCDLSKREKLAALGDAVPDPVKRRAVMARVEKHFRGRPIDDVNYALNVVLREAYRYDHGSTTEWDRDAARAGVVIHG